MEDGGKGITAQNPPKTLQSAGYCLTGVLREVVTDVDRVHGAIALDRLKDRGMAMGLARVFKPRPIEGCHDKSRALGRT